MASSSSGPKKKEKSFFISHLSDEQIQALLNEEEDDDCDDDSDFSDESEESDESDDDMSITQSADNEQPGSEEENTVDEICPSSPLLENVEWSNTPPKNKPNFVFSGQRGLKILPDNETPIQYFYLLFTDNLFDSIVGEINLHSEEVYKKAMSFHSRIVNWRELSVEEFKVFLGLYFHCGIIKLSRWSEYWNSNDLFSLKFFSRRMGRDRFMSILSTLSFLDTSKRDRSTSDPLFKISCLTTHFHKRMHEILEPGKHINIDESVTSWRGQMSIQRKYQRYGIKLYMLTEPDGLIHKFLIYAGVRNIEKFDQEHASIVVEKLIEGLDNSGRSLFLKEFYNNIDLTKSLLTKSTYVTGILSTSGRDISKEVASKRLKRGEIIERWSKEGINITKWKSNHYYMTISTEFSAKDEQTANNQSQSASNNKPYVLQQYRKYIGGIDHVDQYLSYYITIRKGMKWYKSLGLHIFEMMLLNSYILYKRYSGKRTDLYNFRISVIKSLIGPNPSTPKDPPKSSSIINSKHFPITTYYSENGTGRKKQKRCRGCYKKTKKYVLTYCPGCEGEPGLCLDCFVNYHKKEKNFQVV